MKTRKLRKAILTLCSALLLVSLSVGATLAYLTNTSEVVTNTFTVGNVTITLDEGTVHTYGGDVAFEGNNPTEENHGKHIAEDAAKGERVTENEYKLIPGREYDKDPTVHVAANSEDCYVFVKIDNGIYGFEKQGKEIATQILTNWTAVDGADNVYAYPTRLNAGESAVVFTTFTPAGDADVASLADVAIVVTAYAVQAEGFNSALEAWTAAPKAEWQNTNP